MGNQRKRRTFTREFKAEAVALVMDKGMSVAQVSRELELSHSVVGKWVREARLERGTEEEKMTSDERDELLALRREVKDLRMERDILKKAAAFFAKESK